MRKNYTYNTNQRDEIYIRERTYDLHLRRLQNIKDDKKIYPFNQPPIDFYGRANVMKQKSKNFETKVRENSLSKENANLYSRLVVISNRSFNDEQSQVEDESPHNLNLNYRKKVAEQIQEENEKMAKRIINQEPCIDFSQLENQHINQQQIKHRLMKHDQLQNYIQKLRFQQQIYIRSQDFSMISEINMQSSRLVSQQRKTQTTKLSPLQSCNSKTKWSKASQKIINRSIDSGRQDEKQIRNIASNKVGRKFSNQVSECLIQISVDDSHHTQDQQTQAKTPKKKSQISLVPEQKYEPKLKFFNIQNLHCLEQQKKTQKTGSALQDAQSKKDIIIECKEESQIDNYDIEKNGHGWVNNKHQCEQIDGPDSFKYIKDDDDESEVGILSNPKQSDDKINENTGNLNSVFDIEEYNKQDKEINNNPNNNTVGNFSTQKPVTQQKQRSSHLLHEYPSEDDYLQEEFEKESSSRLIKRITQ